MMIYVKLVISWCFVTSAVRSLAEAQNVTENEIRPYEFTFNIVDFQHRSEKKGDDGLITGEYGFITADGIYHETAYATDKTGDFIITKMKHRKITSLKDAEEIFKDQPEQAKMLAEALMKSCEGCDISELDRQESASFVRSESTTVIPKKVESRLEKKMDLAMKEMMKVLNKKSEAAAAAAAAAASTADNEEDKLSRKEKKLPASFSPSQRSGKELSPINDTTAMANEIIRDMVDAAKKVLEIGGDAPAGNSAGKKEKGATEPTEDEAARELASNEVLEKMANDLFYRFNYTITSHGHWEDGFRNGRKDGEYNAKFKEGVDTHVKYVSNEFGHQPNITLVPRREERVLPSDLAVAGSGAAADADNATTPASTTSTSTGMPYKGHYFSWFRK